ncbi:MAG: hypothetical protein HYY18_10020 [Planctomycetes bacterium]|nr:hypothetical protein [Planctomycetota bacterium]
MSRLAAIVLLVLSAFAWRAVAEDAAAPGPHGGSWLEVPDNPARFEVVTDEKLKRATVYAFEKDGTTPLPLKDAPELKLLGAESPLPGKALALKDGTSSEFEFEAPDPKTDAAEPAPPAPSWLHVGTDVGHLEMTYLEKKGRVFIRVFDKDGKAPLPLKDAPRLNLDTMEGAVQLVGKAVGLKDGAASQFEFEGGDLKAGPPALSSRFAVRVGAKQYQVDLVDRNHGHSHGPPK